jgi:hypothetical protein
MGLINKLLICADDIDLLGENMKTKTEALLYASKEICYLKM